MKILWISVKCPSRDLHQGISHTFQDLWILNNASHVIISSHLTSLLSANIIVAAMVQYHDSTTRGQPSLSIFVLAFEALGTFWRRTSVEPKWATKRCCPTPRGQFIDVGYRQTLLLHPFSSNWRPLNTCVFCHSSLCSVARLEAISTGNSHTAPLDF